MALVANIARDTFGNAIPEATISVFIADTETLTTIYSDNNNTLIKANPFDADENGQYSFFADPGEVKIRVEKQGFETFELDFVPVPVISNADSQLGARIEYAGGNQVIAASTPTQIQFDTLVYDDASMVNLPTIDLVQDGMYHVWGQVGLTPGGTTATEIVMNSLAPIANSESLGFTVTSSVTVNGIYRGTAGDKLDLDVEFTGGQGEVISGATFLTVALLYPL